MRFVLPGLWALSCLISFYVGKIPLSDKLKSRSPASIDEVSVVVGQKISVIFGADKGISYNAKVDTGAESSSLHALDIKIHWIKEKSRKIPYVSFKTVDDDMNTREFFRRVSRIDDVKNANGKMIRYYIEEKVTVLNKEIKTEVSLTDRSDLTFKFLLGKNTLKSLDLIVDTSKDIIIYENSSPRYVYRAEK
jgi:hypothetical protein